jgi:thiol-disulfide isomerase/thioredoxin
MHSWLTIGLLSLLLQQPNAETRIVEYLKANVQPGRAVVVSELYNNVFKTPEERRVLDRLFNTFFKIPMTIVQYNTATRKLPTLQELSEQLQFRVPGQMDVMLRIMESDPRIPKFLTRDARSGEITSVDVEAIRNNPRFGRILERSIAGWEGKEVQPFTIQTFSGQTIDSTGLAGKPFMIYFWFSNCPPCMRTGPLLVELHNKYASQGFQIIAANADRFLELEETDADRAAYVNRLGIKFTTAHMSPEMQLAYGGISVYPTMFFVDKNGQIRKHFVNFQDKAILEAAIQEALN